MARDSTDGSITTEAAFEMALCQRLSEAIQNDSNPTGHWVSRHGASAPDLEVMVVEVEKPADLE